MNEIWVLVYASSWVCFLFLFGWKILKSTDKKIDTIAPIVGIWLLSFLVGIMITHLVKPQPYLISWVYRVGLFTFGSLAVWGLYELDWARRDTFDSERDGFEKEFIFIGLVSCGTALLMSVSPTLVGFATKTEMQHWFPQNTFWDAGLCSILPFLMVKMVDSLTQIPYPDFVLQNQWVCSKETLETAKTWKDKNNEKNTLIYFEIEPSALSEYRFFHSRVTGGVNFASKQTLADFFCGFVRKRYAEGELPLLQDFDKGTPIFWLSFRLKYPWYHLKTWFQTPHYLKPSDTIESLQIPSASVICVERVSFK
jgi:hypothetical protein